MRAKLALTILAVEDLSRARAFYTAVFSWRQVVDTRSYVEYALPDDMRLGLYERNGFAVNVGLHPARVPHNAITATELYFYTADLAAAGIALLNAGARELSPLAKRDWNDEAAYYADLDGNVIVIARPLP